MTLDVNVRAVPPDPRKIPWLWEATATVASTQRLASHGGEPVSFSMSWRVLFCFAPDAKAKECWREITDLRHGQTIRRQFHNVGMEPRVQVRGRVSVGASVPGVG